MEQKKTNNKGFSLVELIVVVLIMAIIAVSLAPQVMKWVENSKLATDRQTSESVVSGARLALGDYEAHSVVIGSGGYTITLDDSGCVIKKGTETIDTSDAFLKSFCESIGVSIANPVTDVVLKTDSTVTITISSEGVVSTNAKTVLSNADFE